MSIFDKQLNIFQRFGIWSLLLVSTPLLLLGWVQSLSPSHRSVNRSTNIYQNSVNYSTASNWEQGQVKQEASKNTSSSDNKLSNQVKTEKQPTKKPQPVKAKKQSGTAIAAKNNRKQKKVAKKPEYSPPPLEIRVAIAKDVSSLVIGSSAAASIVDAKGKLLQKLPTDQAFNIQPNNSSLLLGDRQLPAAVWIYPHTGAVYVGDRWYRGRVLLLSQGTTMLAVNYVNLEQYLYSVVGSEMHPTAPAEALKAQAVAARSYALVHLVRPASSWYDLGATQRWQVYKGLNSEYNTSHQAVKQTTGQILSYEGGIVESLYAASDEIVAQAHGGVGMSQTGAYKLAAQGYDYRQILAMYYPGTETARLEMKK